MLSVTYIYLEHFTFYHWQNSSFEHHFEYCTNAQSHKYEISTFVYNHSGDFRYTQKTTPSYSRVNRSEHICPRLKLAARGFMLRFSQVRVQLYIVLTVTPMFYKKVKASSYIVQYPVLRTIQSTLHFISMTDLFTQTPSWLLWEASSYMLQYATHLYS